MLGPHPPPGTLIQRFAGYDIYELSHVCAWGDSDREFGIEGLSEAVEHAKAGYGAASFEPRYS
jgi:hypothetical protein